MLWTRTHCNSDTLDPCYHQCDHRCPVIHSQLVDDDLPRPYTQTHHDGGNCEAKDDAEDGQPRPVIVEAGNELRGGAGREAACVCHFEDSLGVPRCVVLN